MGIWINGKQVSPKREKKNSAGHSSSWAFSVEKIRFISASTKTVYNILVSGLNQISSSGGFGLENLFHLNCDKSSKGL